jgi:ATP adenylyltransferase
MGRLDASWRGDYITAATEAERDVTTSDPTTMAGCVFCRILAGDPQHDNDEDNLIVHRGDTAFVVLNRYPYTSGHLMVLPYRHVAMLDELTDSEHIEIWNLVRTAANTITRAYQPEGLNVGANLGRAAGAGVPGHLHVHALPRWNGDTNFMTSIGETRVVPEALSKTYARIMQAWE